MNVQNSKINKLLTNNRVFSKICIYIGKVTSMVKYFTDVRKLLRTSKYVPYCREVGGVKAASGVLGES